MSNMNYCRFENTLEDLRDCYYHIYDEDLSESEKEAKLKLMKLCEKVVAANNNATQ